MPMTVTGLLAEQGVDAFGVDISPAFCSSVVTWVPAAVSRPKAMAFIQ